MTGLEAFRDILGILSAISGLEVDMNSERVKTVREHLKALEIIIEKEVDIYELKRHIDDLNAYNFWCDSMSLKEEDFKILKEVIMNGKRMG